jgi:hypothetical protein
MLRLNGAVFVSGFRNVRTRMVQRAPPGDPDDVPGALHRPSVVASFPE